MSCLGGRWYLCSTRPREGDLRMAVPITSLRGRHYVGDLETKIVHDVIHEDPTPEGCKIWELVRSGRAVGFESDRLQQALREGYTPCPKCLYNYQLRRPAFTQRFLKGVGE